MSGTDRANEMQICVLQITNIEFTFLNMLPAIIEGLEREGYEVYSAYSLGDSTEEIIEAGHRVINIPVGRKALTLAHFKTIYRLYKLIRQTKCHIVHLHTPLVAFLGRIAAKFARVPTIIYTAHGFYFHDDMNPYLRGILVLLERIVGRYATDWIFTVSLEDAEFAIEHKFQREDRIIWIGNGVDIAKFAGPFNRMDIRKSLGIGIDNVVVGFVGRIVEEKGILELIEAFVGVINRIPEAKLLVVGETLMSERDKQAKVKIEKLIEAKNIRDSIIFTGYRRDVPELLSVMDVFVLPSWREGLPTAIIEAMASGKPVVAANIRGCREVVVDGETGILVPARDPSKLEEAIVRILSDKQLAGKMGENGRKRAIEQYDIRLMVERQLIIYRRIAREIRDKG